jgi:hypothetical protein
MGVPRFRLVTKAARGLAERLANVIYFTAGKNGGNWERGTGTANLAGFLDVGR